MPASVCALSARLAGRASEADPDTGGCLRVRRREGKEVRDSFDNYPALSILAFCLALRLLPAVLLLTVAFVRARMRVVACAISCRRWRDAVFRGSS